MRSSLLPGPAFVAVLALTLASPVLAEEMETDEGPRFSRNGPYIGAAFAVSQAQFAEVQAPNQLPGITFDPGLGFDPALGFAVRLGYRINEFVAMDLSIRRTTDSNLGITRNIQTGPGMFQTVNYTPDGKLLTVTPGLRIYPFGSLDWRFQPSVIAQAGYMLGVVPTLDTTSKGFAARVGGGLEAFITDEIVFFTDIAYVVASGDTSKLDHIGYDFGFLYRF